MQSNPIQQRIELICENWEEAKKQAHARVIRMQSQPDESDMVDTFFTYMIANDSPILDIAFHFESNCLDVKSFSESLLRELEEIVNVWNNSQKTEQIEFVPVNWKPDFGMASSKNAASLFVRNFNLLAERLDLEPGLFTVAVFKGIADSKLLTWFKQAIEAGISPAVKFLVSDTIAKPCFDKIARACPLVLHTIPLNLNMPKAMEQVASMGDPNDPGTAYRVLFIKMINAMGAQDENEAEKIGLECIRLANENITRDPYWIMQLVVLYVALGNDKIRYKKKKETLAYADKAVETATASQEYFATDAAASLLAQALMFRATVLFVQEKWNNAFNDFTTAFEIYIKQNNSILAIEASRMAGMSAFKESQKIRGIKILAEGARLGKTLNSHTARASTFAGLLELLLPANHELFISSSELDEICSQVYGEDCKKIIYQWKKAPAPEIMQMQ